jgi:hypothetical protein
MSDQSSKPPQPSPATVEPAPAPRSVREVAEAVYDELLDSDAAADETTETPPVDETVRARDASGRFVARETAAEPGEADAVAKPVPAPPEVQTSEEKPAQPAPEQGKSIELPPHWPEADRKTFGELTPGGKELFVRRYSEMERDYTQKTQAAAQAVTFVQTVAPIFQHPQMVESLKTAQASPSEAIDQWARFHLGIMHPDPRVRLATVQEIARRAQIDPATAAPGQSGAPALTAEELKHPAIRFLADTLSRTTQEQQALRSQFQAMVNQQQAERQTAVQGATEDYVNSFAEAVDGQGRKLHPYFDRVIEELKELFQANPKRDMADAYKRACRMNDAVYEEMQQAGRLTAEQHAANQRAALAAKGNIRGRTAPVSTTANGAGEKKSLRATLEAAADEAGIN